MRQIQLGHSGPFVSPACLGTMYFGSKLDAVTAAEIADAYVGAGGQFIDTANIYAGWIEGCRGGESEEFLGGWMRDRKNRSSLIVATKMGFPYRDVPQSASADLVVSECEKSLRRLKTDFVDLFFIHCDDPATPLDETLEALELLRRSGKVRFVGASNYSAIRLARALDIAAAETVQQFCCIQQRHSFLTPAPGVITAPQVVADKGLLEQCKNRSLGLMAYSPLIGGLYSDLNRPLPPDYKSPENVERLDVLASICVETGATGNQVVLAWMRESQVPTVPLLGVSSTGQLKENLVSLTLELSHEQIWRMDRAHFEA
ncbi:MAG: aldo/keto reductase [Paracoccaceae bacterium]|nr:aldo/keto reductase [Paracoccaceae bacterium]